MIKVAWARKMCSFRRMGQVNEQLQLWPRDGHGLGEHLVVHMQHWQLERLGDEDDKKGKLNCVPLLETFTPFKQTNINHIDNQNKFYSKNEISWLLLHIGQKLWNMYSKVPKKANRSAQISPKITLSALSDTTPPPPLDLSTFLKVAMLSLMIF